MKVYYIWDAYCGWCYGFDKVFLEFIKNHDELDLEIISGGLFDNKKINEFQHIERANMQISEIFGVEFSEDYNKVSAKGELVMNSIHPATAFGIFRKYLSKNDIIEAAYEIQKKLYVEGKSLSDINIYSEVAKKFDLDAEQITKEIELEFSKNDKYHEDFIVAHNMGVQGFPTVLIEKEGKFYDLRSGVMTTEELEKNYTRVKEL